LVCEDESYEPDGIEDHNDYAFYKKLPVKFIGIIGNYSPPGIHNRQKGLFEEIVYSPAQKEKGCEYGEKRRKKGRRFRRDDPPEEFLDVEGKGCEPSSDPTCQRLPISVFD
jgi:hypothetical protein